jgi:NDP-sugar pyrophosphorylase family protein
MSIEFLDMMNNEFDKATDFSTEILGKLIGKIYSYETKEIFMDIGTPEMYTRANQLAV